MVGETLDGKYKLVRPLGEGGMGAVYEALHLGTGRRVAVKVIASETLTKNADMITRFQREARASGAIETQHIAHVLDTGTDAASGRPYLVMEFLAGEDVAQLIARVGPLAPDVAMRIVAQACLGLQKAHESGVVHRDIKPANLYMASRDAGEVVVKLLDFGIAKIRLDQLASVESAGLTKTGAMLGSPLYMSPEQAQGAKTTDARTDLWSLGVVLYQLLSGKTPHGHIDTMGGLILAICSQPPRLVQDHAPWVAPEVAAIVHRALRIDVASRFQSASEMLDALRAQLPAGTALHERSLVPMTEQALEVCAPRLEIAASNPLPTHHAESAFDATLPDPAKVPGITTTAGVAQPRPAETKRSSMLYYGVAALIVLSGGGFAASRWIGARAALVPPQPPTIQAEVPSVTASSAPPAPIPVPSLSFPLGVPAGSKVDVDGVSTPVSGTAVVVNGPPGSDHAVHVVLGKAESSTSVHVTNGGLVPDRIVLATPTVVRAPPSPGPLGPPQITNKWNGN